ncbi:Carrier protein, mitochondrial [Rhodotorula kratochvilovae]
MLLENALSEELPSLPPPSPPLALASLRAPPRAATATATDTDKMLAACIGAVLTSLTMTPFDVIKTRLQTQAPPDPAFTPSPSRLPPSHPLATSPWPPPVASTSSAPPPSIPTAGGKPAVCCNTRSYCSANPASAPHPPSAADRSLLCRFDPRIARAALPAAGAHLAHAPVHHLASSSAAFALPASSAASVACLYPPSHPSLSLTHTPHAPARHLSGFLDALTHILRSEGPSALWRGTAPALLMSVPGQVVYMVGYDSLRRAALQRTGDAPAFAAAVPLVAGAASRAAVAALLSPFELLRTRLQAQTRATRVPLRALVAQLRWRTAWTGLSSTLWRDVPFSGVYWAGYEAIRRALTGGRGMGDARGAQGGMGEFAVAFVSGAGSGLIAATLTNPFDVIKTRRQALSPSPSPSPSTSSVPAPATDTRTLSILRAILRTEGARALWSGLTPRLAKVGPACGLMIGCYEAISGWRAQGRLGAVAAEGWRGTAEEGREV